MTVRTSPRSVLASKLPHVGTTIPETRDKDVFRVMSPPYGGAQETGAINLGQGFPDFPTRGFARGTPTPRLRSA